MGVFPHINNDINFPKSAQWMNSTNRAFMYSLVVPLYSPGIRLSFSLPL